MPDPTDGERIRFFRNGGVRDRLVGGVPLFAVNVSSQVIGDPIERVWCSTCQDHTASIGDLALLVTPAGVESYECDPVTRLATVFYCDGCATYFELPDVPVLVDNRGS